MILTSDIIKACLYYRYRYKLNYAYCADEVNYSDFLFITNLNYVGEIEIKISISDLKADFKKQIHKSIKQKYKIDRNYFYFAIPDYLYDKAKPIIEEQGNYYGIITINSKFLWEVTTKKYAKLLTPCFDNEYIFEDIKKSIVKRLSSKITNEQNINILRKEMEKEFVYEKKNRDSDSIK